MYILELFVLILVLLVVLNAARQYSGHSDYTYWRLLAGTSRDCPLKCRCMALGHLSLHVLGQNWQSDEAWRAESLSGLNNSDLQGSDMVCTGRGAVPWPLPDGRLNHCLLAPFYDVYACVL